MNWASMDSNNEYLSKLGHLFQLMGNTESE